MKLRTDLDAEDLETLQEIEQDLKDKEPGLWNISADISIASLISNNVNSVSKTRKKSEEGEIAEFTSAMYDKTSSGGISLSATRPIGEESSFLANISHTTSNQHQEHDDDFQSYGLTLGLDTVLGGQSLSPYFTVSKSDYHTDADSFSTGMGVGGFFTVGERHSFSYGYSYSEAKGNHNSSDVTARDTNSTGHGYTFSHDYIFTQIISTSIGLGYSDSDAIVDAGNDYETYDLSLGINLSFPWAYIAISNGMSFNDYKKEDTSVASDRLRSDFANTFDIMLTKAIGDIFPAIDQNRNLFINLSYEKVISEANTLNYDYHADSFSLSFTKSF